MVIMKEIRLRKATFVSKASEINNEARREVIEPIIEHTKSTVNAEIEAGIGGHE